MQVFGGVPQAVTTAEVVRPLAGAFHAKIGQLGEQVRPTLERQPQQSRPKPQGDPHHQGVVLQPQAGLPGEGFFGLL